MSRKRLENNQIGIYALALILGGESWFVAANFRRAPGVAGHSSARHAPIWDVCPDSIPAPV